MKKIIGNIHQLELGIVNAFLIVEEELTLIDVGFGKSWDKISVYIEKIGRKPSEIKHIIITHLHQDHTGSLAIIQKATRALVYMHPLDAALVQKGQAMRETLEISPGIVNQIFAKTVLKNAPRTVTPAKTDVYIEDKTIIPIGKGLEVIHVPGHSAGQIALLYPDFGRVLFAADTCAYRLGLRLSPCYESLKQGYQDLKKLSKLSFEYATFGHGGPIKEKASDKFRKKFGNLKVQ